MSRFTSGTRIGHYEILDSIGAGGMGEVYRARDTRLNRDVAIKILPDTFASDPDRVARFTREAQTLASLSHPHIAQVHGLEPAGSTSALVMELVDGEDLAQRLVRGPISVDEALPIARQIADALEAAHEKGIVHRDLKPANIKVRADGSVKVLDFGLAKAANPVDSGALNATVTSPAMTQAGIILGTAAYMSPEQARGKPVDKRADIWAFGCVLYEMLSGKPTFGGGTVTDVIAAVVKSEPDWNVLPNDTPSSVRRLLRRALQKDPQQRMRDAGDARLEIDAADEEVIEAVVALPSTSRSRVPTFLAAALVVLALGAAGGVWWQASRASNGHWTATQLGGPRIAFLPRLSPDGRTVAFLTLVGGQSQLAVMNTESGDWSLLTRQQGVGPIVCLSWAPDGSRIFFDRSRATGREIYSISSLGGEPRLVLDNARVAEPVADGSLLFVRTNAEGFNQLHRFWPESGRIQPLPVHVHSSFAASLRVFPDGREAVVFGRALNERAPDSFQLLAIDLESGRTRVLGQGLHSNLFAGTELIIPVAVSPKGDRVLTAIRDGNSNTVVAVPRDGSSDRTMLFTTTSLVASIDESVDGRYYVDQLDRTIEHLRFPIFGGIPERLATGLPSTNAVGALALPDGRFVYASMIAGRQRLVAGRPGEELTPFVETQEEARAPLARINDQEFMFVAGSREAPVVAIASSQTGRVSRRLEGTRGRPITRLAVSPIGDLVYFSAAGQIWTVPIADGEPTLVTRGTGMTLDPQGRFLVIERPEGGGVHLVRRDQNGSETRITWSGDMRPTGLSLWAQALTPNGRLLFVSESDDSWFWGPAIYDFNTNQITRVPLAFSGDVEVDTAWHGDQITALGRRLEGSIWRFRRVP